MDELKRVRELLKTIPDPERIYVYIAGPIGKDPARWDENVAKAFGYATPLLEAGAVPFVPHTACFWDRFKGQDYETWRKWSCAWLHTCNALLRVPGESPGADDEVKEMSNLGRPIFYVLENCLDWVREIRAERAINRRC